MPDSRSTEYINSVDYQILVFKLTELNDVIDDLASKTDASRKLRYADVDIEAEREAGRFLPDELYVYTHLIDTNIRREQSPYVQYITQSPRAVICKNKQTGEQLELLDKDLTNKLRYDAWQLPMFANIDGFQANGYSIIEVVQDQNNPGEVGHEVVQMSDFAFLSDTRDIQAVEMTGRAYYYTKTRLLALCGDGTKPDTDWDRSQVDKIISKDPTTQNNTSIESNDPRDRSLYKVIKNMFRVNGIVHVAWSCAPTCDNWVRKPRPLYIGRRKPKQYSMMQKAAAMMQRQQLPISENQYETNYPYILFPYLISENDTISQLKGRVFLDQDLQEAVSSLMSSTVTQARRAAGLYFSKDVSDPNDEILLEKNIFLRSGCLINAKINTFNLPAPDPSMFSSINMLVSTNQNETSQVNFAVNNRKDSRKTAEEVKTSAQQQQILSTVQVVLFSIALTQMYRLMVDVIVSRVKAGLIQVDPTVRPLYDIPFLVSPSGDVDVIQKAELVKQMMNAWPVIQNTGAATVFLLDLLEKMFPESAQKYTQAITQAQQQTQQQQSGQMQQLLVSMKQLADGVIALSKKPEMFSDTGRIHALPRLEFAAEQLEQMQKQLTNGNGKQ